MKARTLVLGLALLAASCGAPPTTETTPSAGARKVALKLPGMT
jgi:hypothetical protein